MENLENKNLSILIVDDEEDLLYVYKQCILMFEEYSQSDIRLAHDGEDLINQVNENIFDVVLIDRNMPKMDDAEKIIREVREKQKEAIVIITSGFLQDKLFQELESSSVINGYLKKPFRIKELIYKIDSLLN